MSKKNGILGLIDKMNLAAGRFVSFIVPLIGFLIMYEVVMRYIFDRPTRWVHDTSQLLFGVIYMLGAGCVLFHRRHVNMDMLYTRFSVKGKALTDVVTGVLALVFLGVLVWKSGIMAYESVIFNEHLKQSTFEPPLYPIKIVFFIGCILFLLQALANFIRDVITLFGRREKALKIENQRKES